MDNQRVLIIDDDKNIADLFSIVLRMVGFECEIVNSAREGLSKLAFYTPDIVLLDLRLGLELGGEDILYQIRTNPRLEHTRVVVITGYPSLAEPIANLTDLTLIKPVDINQLRTLVQRVSSSEKKPKTEYFRDPLTGLFHQEFFQTRLEHAFERRKRLPEFLYGVVVFSLNFNPPLEEETPDELRQIMKSIGARLSKNFRPTDTIARIATYKFASLHEDLKKPEDIQVILKRLKNNLLCILREREKISPPELSIGAALCEDRFEKPEHILEAAERNMRTISISEESQE